MAPPKIVIATASDAIPVDDMVTGNRALADAGRERSVDGRWFNLAVMLHSSRIVPWIQRTTETKWCRPPLLVLPHHTPNKTLFGLRRVFSDGLAHLCHGLGTANIEPLPGLTILLQKPAWGAHAANTPHDAGGNVSFLDLLYAIFKVVFAPLAAKFPELDVAIVAIDSATAATEHIILVQINDRADASGFDLNLRSVI